MSYSVSDKYKHLVPTLSKFEYDSLKNSIKDQGLLNPIVKNADNVILDGHNRLSICLELKIEPEFITHEFNTQQQEEIYVIETNLKRRQLNKFQIAELGQILQKVQAKYAGQRSLSNLKNNSSPLALSTPKQAKTEPVNMGKTAGVVAKKIGLTLSTYEKSLTIMNSNDEKLKQSVRDDKVTIQKAYSGIMNKRNKKNTLDEIKKYSVKLPKTINLYNKDFRDLKIKPNSVSLIFTDPPYVKESISIYSDLAKQAMQVLRPGGSLCCFVGQFAILEIIKRLQDEGLVFQWILACVHTGKSNMFYSKGIINGWKPILLCTKGKIKKLNATKDCILSTPPNKTLHKWAQSTDESDYYIENLSEKNSIVYDPFMGSGTVGVSAKKYGRQFIGSEIDKEHFNTAKLNISKKIEAKTK